MLNEFTVKQLLPALITYDVVVVDGYGLNALLYATAGTTCDKLDAAATKMHHAVVEARVLAQGIHPPLYPVTQAAPGPMTEYLQGVKPGLTEEQCLAFLDKEARIIEGYFDGTGQQGFLLPPELSVEEMGTIVAKEIEPHIDQRRQLAA